MIVPTFPVGAEQRQARLMTQVGPQARAWILQEAGRVAVTPVITEQAATATVRAKFASFGSMSESDISALIFMVLMEATKSAQNDLKSIMAGIKAINDAKERARHAISHTQNKAASSPHGRPSGFSATIAQTSRPTFGRVMTSPAPIAKALLDGQINMARNDVDKLSEMGETESLRLQMAVDRTSKMMSTLSNALKKMSSTESSIISNLK